MVPPLVLIINSELPYKTLKELIDDAAAHPNKISFGTSGPATSPAIAMTQLNHTAGTKIVDVPYRGSGEAAAAVVTGAVQATFTFYTAAKPLTDGGKVRPSRLQDHSEFQHGPMCRRWKSSVIQTSTTVVLSALSALQSCRNPLLARF